jgi:hypothetical protein
MEDGWEGSGGRRLSGCDVEFSKPNVAEWSISAISASIT